jgi:hypothetical protein
MREREREREREKERERLEREGIYSSKKVTFLA